jgi:hypothetical protein
VEAVMYDNLVSYLKRNLIRIKQLDYNIWFEITALALGVVEDF